MYACVYLCGDGILWNKRKTVHILILLPKLYMYCCCCGLETFGWVGVGVVGFFFFGGGVWLLYISYRLCVCWCAGLSCTDVDYACVCVAA